MPAPPSFSDEEVGRLREYLLKGGFLWSDDFWGTPALQSFESELARVLPPARLPDPGHHARTIRSSGRCSLSPRFRRFPRSSTGGGAAGTHRSAATTARRSTCEGIADVHGRLMVLMTHNTDISDAWEREGEDPRFFYEFSPKGYAVGINVVLYSLTH